MFCCVHWRAYPQTEMLRPKRQRETLESAARFGATLGSANPKRLAWTSVEVQLRRAVSSIAHKLHQNNFGQDYDNDQLNESVFTDLCTVIRAAVYEQPDKVIDKVIDYINDPSIYSDDDLLGPYQHAAIYCACNTVFPVELRGRINRVDKPLVIGALLTGVWNIARWLLVIDPWRINERFAFKGEEDDPFGTLKAALPGVDHVDTNLVDFLLDSGAGPTGFRDEHYNRLGRAHPRALLRMVMDGTVDPNVVWTKAGVCVRRYNTDEMIRWIEYGLDPWKACSYSCYLTSEGHSHSSVDNGMLSGTGHIICIAFLARIYPEWAKLWALLGKSHTRDLIEAVNKDEALVPRPKRDQLGPHTRAFATRWSFVCQKIL